MNNFFDDTDLICEAIFNNDYSYWAQPEEKRDILLHKKIALDIEKNIELITREYEEKYPGISLKMKDYFNRFKSSSQRYNEELQKDWFEINYVARPEFARMHNYKIEIAEQYGILRRD